MTTAAEVGLTARPIDLWPGELTPDHRRSYSRFDASWTDTVELLKREVAMLGARDAVLQLAITERECRRDGWIRADAKPAHPGVILSFESRHGPLRYATDQFTGGGVYRRLPGWQANVRAIALGLEALRKVDRYGIARGGEQYRGWNALPPAREAGAAMTLEGAAEFLTWSANDAHGADWVDVSSVLGNPDTVDARECIQGAYRDAVKLAHPDAGGDPATFRRLTEARDMLLEAL